MVSRMRPDLALVDLHLGKLMTLDLLRRAQEGKLKTRVIVLANRGERKTIMETLRAGAVGFLLKSATSRNLEDAIHQVLRGSLYVSPGIDIHSVLPATNGGYKDSLDHLSSR